MPTPVQSRSSSPIRDEQTEESATTTRARATTLESGQGETIPANLRPLLQARNEDGSFRPRSPVRDRSHADRRWSELPDRHHPRSIEEADRIEAALRASHLMPEGHDLRIDFETYRLLLESMQARAKDLPPVRQSAFSEQMTAFAGMIHLMPEENHLGDFKGILREVEHKLPPEQQGVPLVALIEESRTLSNDFQGELREKLFGCVAKLPPAQQNRPMQALADRLRETAEQIRLPDHSNDIKPFSIVLDDIMDKLPERYRRAPLVALMTVIGSQPRQHHQRLIEDALGRIKTIRSRTLRDELRQALADSLD
ncbi:hypothetical protein [Burkholderia stabilis]|uniref:hypothetical protein n=1 Tax=Burkholderia stabilis TaxID=95485 RepID=UPI001590B8CF|nr:hypothetical protein [Burkholderia stabilis]